MTTIDSSTNSTLTKLASSYKSNDAEKTETEDYIGREAFLTMLIAQLQNQDPLNPMEGSDFSAQLAQFSSLEQLININTTMESMADAFQSSSETDASTFIGKKVTGNANSIDVSSGTPSEGIYSLKDTAEVMISISNSEGHVVRTIYPGQQTEGGYSISWDGKDNGGSAVDDGSYTYKVFSNTGAGYTELPTTITGVVSGVVYQNDKAYLDIDGVLLSPDSVTKISDADIKSNSDLTILDYLGKDISYSNHIISVDKSNVSGGDIKFNLENTEDVIIDILDSKGNVINSVQISKDNLVAGENTINWAGIDSAGNTVSDGIYSYSVKSESDSAEVSDSGEVTGIKYINGTQYLVVGDDNNLVGISSVTEIN